MIQSAADGSSWQPLVARLAGDEPLEGRLVSLLLERWLEESGAQGAALYLRQENRLARERQVGEGSFPALLQEIPEELSCVEMPQGLLAFKARQHQQAASTHLATDGPATAILAMICRVLQLKRQLKKQDFEVSLKGVEQQALYDVGLAIGATLELEDLSGAILYWAMSLLDARAAALYLVDGVAKDGGPQAYSLNGALGGDALPALRTDDPAELPAELFPDAQHRLAVRIETSGSARGLLVVADKESRHGVGPFGDGDRRTLSLFANQAAIALENARLHQEALLKEGLEREFKLAADIQKRILPQTTPQVEGYEMAGWNRPARQAGGDYYDFHDAENGRVILSLGDVTGKGMPAALMVSTLHSALRLMLEGRDLDPAILARLNRHILESSAPNKFITLVVAELDAERSSLRYVNAGHNTCVVVGKDGEVRELLSSGLPIGLMPGASYELGELSLEPGDLVCLYSDGITEAEAPNGEEFDLPGLLDLLQEHQAAPLPEIIARIDSAITAFAQHLPQGDDQTVVLLRRLA